MDFLKHPETDRIIEAALVEDIGEGDHTTLSTIPRDAKSKMKCLIKEEGIVAGIALTEYIFKKMDSDIEFEALVKDGDKVKVGDIAFKIRGRVHTLLTGERLVLNLMQRMSGIATYTAKLMKELEGLDCKVLDTRKTTPLIRHFEKWAVQIGGGGNHRFGLYDMILIKDNHVDFAGGIKEAIEACGKYLKANRLDLKVEIETRDLEEVKQVLEVGGVDRIMLDNMAPETMREAVRLIAGRMETEGSGNIILENIRTKAESGVDFLSLGALTHSVKSMDISLKADLD